MNDKVLIVDDEPDIRELLEITLGRMSLDTTSAKDLKTAKQTLESESFQLCLTDMRLPDGNGIELVEYIQKRHPHLPAAVITAHGSTETAIKSLKAGAFDFVSKPVDLAKLRDLVAAALRLSASPSPLPGKDAEDKQGRGFSFNLKPEIDDGIDGNSEAIRQLRHQIRRLARSQAPVFISGESGSGKELAARAIHNHSSRSDNAFIAVNCGAIPSQLMESELFGHVKGSFTGAEQDKQGLFQAANGGTLFLDEVADLPLHTQVKLLRVIQEKAVRPVGAEEEIKVDVRILSATHKNLSKEIERGKLRQDLYFRINVIELNVPSLRQRREDIPVLIDLMLKKIATDNQNLNGVAGSNPTVPSLSKQAQKALYEYDFPGNVRELENILQRAMALSENTLIEKEFLEFIQPISNDIFSPSNSESPANPSLDASPDAVNDSAEFELDEDFSLEKHLENIERKAIEKALQETKWNRTAAAKKLGMTFRSLRYRLKKLDLD